jgi:hypothetical protein
MSPMIQTIAYTLHSGLGDAQGLLHASRIWDDAGVRWIEAACSGPVVALGIVMSGSAFAVWDSWEL